MPGVYVGARSSALAPDGTVRPVLVSILVASALALLIPDDPTRLAWVFAIVFFTAIPLWGAVDATLRPHAAWEEAGHNRTRWVAVQGIGAPSWSASSPRLPTSSTCAGGSSPAHRSS